MEWPKPFHFIRWLKWHLSEYPKLFAECWTNILFCSSQFHFNPNYSNPSFHWFIILNSGDWSQLLPPQIYAKYSKRVKWFGWENKTWKAWKWEGGGQTKQWENWVESSLVNQRELVGGMRNATAKAVAVELKVGKKLLLINIIIWLTERINLLNMTWIFFIQIFTKTKNDELGNFISTMTNHHNF